MGCKPHGRWCSLEMGHDSAHMCMACRRWTVPGMTERPADAGLQSEEAYRRKHLLHSPWTCWACQVGTGRPPGKCKKPPCAAEGLLQVTLEESLRKEALASPKAERPANSSRSSTELKLKLHREFAGKSWFDEGVSAYRREHLVQTPPCATEGALQVTLEEPRREEAPPLLEAEMPANSSRSSAEMVIFVCNQV